MLEVLPFFLGLALLSIVQQGETGDGTRVAIIFLTSRVLRHCLHNWNTLLAVRDLVNMLFGLLLMVLSLISTLGVFFRNSGEEDFFLVPW